MTEQEVIIAIHDTDKKFKYFIFDYIDLILTVDFFPQHADTLVQRVLKDPDHFKRLIESNHNLLGFAEVLPPHVAETLIQHVFKNPSEFKRLFECAHDLVATAKAFPQHAEALIQRVFKDPSEFKRQIKSAYGLTMTAKAFPQHAETLIQRVFKDPSEFKRLIKNNSGLRYIAKGLPQYTETLIQRVFKSPSEFKRLFECAHNLAETAKAFPQHAETLIQRVFKDPSEFKRLIKNNSDLLFMAKAFPQHATIFNKPSIDKAFQAAQEYTKKMQSIAEIRKNARLFAQATRTNTGSCLFKSMPSDLQMKIAAMTGDINIHEKPKRTEIAGRYIKDENNEFKANHYTACQLHNTNKFFSRKMVMNYLSSRRHDSPEAQKLYDTHFGLILKQ